MSDLRYDNQVFVITGAGGSLGKAYAVFFASRGASVVVNDLQAADLVAEAIKAAGGRAVASHDSVNNGERIIQTAIENFGRIDVFINNTEDHGCSSFDSMTDEDWDMTMAAFVHGAYKCIRAAWPIFRKQRYGRIINTSSNIFETFGGANDSAAKMALVGFTRTLALEGLKYNILANVLVPSIATSTTDTFASADKLSAGELDSVLALVATLVHRSNAKETGSVFQACRGRICKVRRERSEGIQMRPDHSLTPAVILNNWDTAVDFSRRSQYPARVSNSMGNLEKGLKLPKNPQTEELNFKGKVALVTGAGAGLGRAYAHAFAKAGAKVVVNDVKSSNKVAQEIKNFGGDAVGVDLSVEDGAGVVEACLTEYGRLDIIVNNAGILRDKAFINMTDQFWGPVLAVHLNGTYKITKAAWPHFVRQRYGRIVNVTSTTGIYGKFGQANYATAKSGIIGFSQALAREGLKHNINVNLVAPSAGTNMTRTSRPEDEVQALKPEFVAPLVVALCSDNLRSPTGGLYETGAGWVAATRWQRSGGLQYPQDRYLTPEAVLKAFHKIVDFDDGRADNPETSTDGSKIISVNAQNSLTEAQQIDFLSRIASAKRMPGTAAEFKYDKRDVILYNLGIGARRDDLPFIYEGDAQFQALPTFGVIPPHVAKAPYELSEILPNFDPRMLLAGEHYLEILQHTIPTEGTLISRTDLVEVLDKGKDAVVRRGTTTVDAATGRPVFYNESASFIRGSGGFGGPRDSVRPDTAKAVVNVPSRGPDCVQEEKTVEELAVLYRLCGDWNALHVDPAFSSRGGFEVPILHGLATFGISGKHIYRNFGPFKSIRARFAGPVLPGQTLVTEMWKKGRNTVLFRVKVKETGKLCITNGAVELMAQDWKAQL